jgi:hypothetical protein
MSIGWINAAVLWGLALAALPIAIHLLVRQQTRTVPYPSLRFVRETALAAFRRRAIQDALLLACRVAIVAVAVLALAGPIVQTPARTSRYAERVSRAVVQLDGDATMDEGILAGAFRAQVFRRASLLDAIGEAVAWLDAQPPSSREVVFTGEFRKGQLTPADLHHVPAGIGVRFVPLEPGPSSDQFTHTTLTREHGRLVFAEQAVGLSADATRVSAATTSPAPADIIRVIAAPRDQSLAEAALNAALDAGLRWPNRNRRVVVIWEGAPPAGGAGETLRMPVPDPPSTAATALWNLVDAATPREAMEPNLVARADLDSWSRPPAGVSPRARPADEGDRRWLWVLALALLALEQWLRREREQARPLEERRVA